MKIIKIIMILFVIKTNTYSQQTTLFTYNDTQKKALHEEIGQNKNKLTTKFIGKKEKDNYEMIVTTNINAGTTEFSIIKQNTTNEFNVLYGKLSGAKTIWDLKGLELILIPEIQLKNFVLNNAQKEFHYMGMRIQNLSVHQNTATKIETNKDGLLLVEITIDNVPKGFVKLHYYFNKNGTAEIKQGFFAGSSKPAFNLVISKNK
ncbi:MAG: hypothetical protein ACRCTQ_01645 [Brevinemataceae bacterium]